MIQARGTRRVLVSGVGTVGKQRYYGDGVESLTVTEPEAPMARKLAQRIREQSRPTELVHAPAENLPFDDDQFDTVVSTLVLCTVEDQARALQELRRVLKADGRLLF